MKQRQVEVLAPAGSFESMKAAIAAGADAVYIGGSQFGPERMRITWMRIICWRQSTTPIFMVRLCI